MSLLPVIAQRHRVVPATLDFNPASGVFASVIGPTPAFSRASGATYIDAAGLVQLAAINVPRITYDPVTHECLGYLAEEQRTNGALQSSQFAGPNWAKNGATVAADNSATSPDGTMSASTLSDPSGTQTGIYSFVGGSVGQISTESLFVKYVSGNPELLIGTDYDPPGCYIVVNIQTGLLVSTGPNVISHTIKPYPNGWFRISVTHAAVTASITCAVNTITGTASTFYLWGFQCELGSFPTSYIPTTTAAATRSADLCSISGADFTGFYNQSEGTWVASGVRQPLQITSPIIGPTLSPGSGVIPIENNQLAWWDDAHYLINPQVAASSFKAAAAYNAAGRSLVLDGGTVASDAFPQGANTAVTIASRQGSAQYLNGTIARLQYFPERLPDSALITLTQP